MAKYFEQFFYDQDASYSFLIEANGEVCYVYLLLNNEIIGDVWLGNQIVPSAQANFSDPEKMPFLNPKEYLLNPKELMIDFEPVSVRWDLSLGLRRVTICFLNDIKVVLEEGTKPGWSNRVKQDGPLAKVIRNEPNSSDT